MPNNLAYYIRLSHADDEIGREKYESTSISHQRELIRNYIDTHSEFDGWTVHEFVDDGFSGTNDDRPDFQRLMELTRQGQIQCIIVKDLSRFARNYILLGDYLEQVFPFLGVRFIAINDGYDSQTSTSMADNMSMVLKSVLNAYYSKDISRKIFSVYTQKMKRGDFLGHAPFGYMQNEEKTHFIIDPPAAETVRRMFDLALEGKNRREIADVLNEEKRLTPAEYNRLHGQVKRNTKSITENPIWEPTKVANILRNPIYTGDYIMRKQVPVVPGSKKRRPTDPSEQFVIKQAHEAIVSYEEYEKVQLLLPKVTMSPRRETPEYTLKGVVRCGACKRTMVRPNGKAVFHCQHARMKHSQCSNKQYPMETIEITIFEALKPMLRTVVRSENQERSRKNQSSDWLKQCQQEITASQFALKRIQQLKLDAYEEYSSGKLTLESYQKEKENLNRRGEELSQKIYSLKEQEDAFYNGIVPHNVQAFRDASRKYQNSTALTREMVTTFVDSVYLYEDHYEIKWKFQDVWEQIQKKLEQKSSKPLSDENTVQEELSDDK